MSGRNKFSLVVGMLFIFLPIIVMYWPRKQLLAPWQTITLAVVAILGLAIVVIGMRPEEPRQARDGDTKELPAQGSREQDGNKCLTCGTEFRDSNPDSGGQVCRSCWAHSH